jgi:hypothetical protein
MNRRYNIDVDDVQLGIQVRLAREVAVDADARIERDDIDLTALALDIGVELLDFAEVRQVDIVGPDFDAERPDLLRDVLKPIRLGN